MAKKSSKRRDKKVSKLREVKLEHSILATTILIILSTIFYRFEVAGETFYLRYVITFFAIIVGVDTISLMRRDDNKSYKYLVWLKRALLIVAIILLGIVAYYVRFMMP